jgi:hypothetical protein
LFERARADGLAMLDGAEAALLRWNAADRAHFKTDDDVGAANRCRSIGGDED